MFNGHTMSVVTDLRMLGPQINDSDLLAIAAITTNNDYPDLPNIYNAGILVPPTSLLMMWSEGGNMILDKYYPEYLCESDPDSMIVALIALLTQKNVVLYIPQEDFNVFGELLLNHIYFMYGVVCNFGNTLFSVDNAKIPMVISKFYMIDVMSAQDYLAAYPPNAPLPDFVISKLIEDLHPFDKPTTFEEYKIYFNQINASKMQQINQQPKEMVKLVKDKLK